MELKRVRDKNLLYVMAAKPEYGAALCKRFAPLFTGIGPVEAAISLSNALHQTPEKPDYILSIGSAGSNKLEQTEIYQVSSVSYRDMDASALGFVKGQTPLLDLPACLELPLKLEGIKSASLSTGASIVSGKAYDLIDADMVDMETFAIQRICMKFSIKLIGLRGISDGKEELQKLEDWTQTLPVIDEKLALVVDQVENAIATDSLIVKPS